MQSSLSQRIILSCILPLILIGSLYIAYTFYASSKTVTSEITAVGNVISASLMDSGAQALVSRQQDFINRQAVAGIVKRDDIAAIEWLTLERKRFMIMADDPLQIPSLPDNKTEDTSDYTIAEYEIYYLPLAGIESFDDDLQLDDPSLSKMPEPALMGYIKIYFDEQYLLNKTYNGLFFELGVMLIILVVTIAATAISAFHLSGTLKQIFGFITQLDNGDYRATLRVPGRDELQSLSRRLNQLATTLAQNQQDIKDERERLNSALIEQTKLRDEADKANDWLKQMLGVLSHEMRTPLNAVVGPIDMLINNAGNPFMTKRLENAQSHINDMLAQLDNLMDYTQLEYGQHTLHKTPTDVRETIERVVSNYQLMAEQKGLSLSSHYSGKLTDTENHYTIDGQRLTQILINLISNAIKFSHAGAITVSWSLTPLMQNIMLITIDVKDQGIGISADMSKNIFEMFHQADSNIARQYGGLGIGLGLCKKYADLFGGQLSMHSQPNLGSTFTLTFSAEKVPMPMPMPKQLSTATENYYFKKRMNVMIIEDNIENCNVLCQLLQRIAPNITLSTECDGQTSLERIQRADFDVDIALVDIHLPKVSGLEIIRAIKARHINTRIVAVTADTSYGNQDACFEAGAQLFIKKPVRLVDIARAFETFEADLPSPS